MNQNLWVVRQYQTIGLDKQNDKCSGKELLILLSIKYSKYNSRERCFHVWTEELPVSSNTMTSRHAYGNKHMKMAHVDADKPLTRQMPVYCHPAWKSIHEN